MNTHTHTLSHNFDRLEFPLKDQIFIILSLPAGTWPAVSSHTHTPMATL